MNTGFALCVHLDWRLHIYAMNVFYYLEDRLKFFQKATPLSTVFSPKVGNPCFAERVLIIRLCLSMSFTFKLRPLLKSSLLKEFDNLNEEHYFSRW